MVNQSFVTIIFSLDFLLLHGPERKSLSMFLFIQTRKKILHHADDILEYLQKPRPMGREYFL